MNIKRKSNQEIFDLIIRDALIDSWDMELAQLDKEASRHEFSKSFEKRVRRIGSGITIKRFSKSAGKFIAKAVVILLVIMGISFGGLMTNSEVSAAVINVFRQVFEDHDKLTYGEGDVTLENFDNTKRLGYVPDGYKLRLGEYASNAVYLTYYDKNENVIELGYGIAESSSKVVDNERRKYSTFSQNGTQYHYYEAIPDDLESLLIWYDDGYDYCILAQLPKDELVKIAENIK